MKEGVRIQLSASFALFWLNPYSGTNGIERERTRRTEMGRFRKIFRKIATLILLQNREVIETRALCRE